MYCSGTYGYHYAEGQYIVDVSILIRNHSCATLWSFMENHWNRTYWSDYPVRTVPYKRVPDGTYNGAELEIIDKLTQERYSEIRHSSSKGSPNKYWYNYASYFSYPVTAVVYSSVSLRDGSRLSLNDQATTTGPVQCIVGIWNNCNEVYSDDSPLIEIKKMQLTAFIREELTIKLKMMHCFFNQDGTFHRSGCWTWT